MVAEIIYGIMGYQIRKKNLHSQSFNSLDQLFL
jgi:hypothetical protein